MNIQNVRSVGRRGEGGVFSGGSYSIRCAMSEHHNSDNFIIAPGVRNGAQHTHDYAGNEGTNFASEDETLEESSTTCTNGDRSPIFWPVLRDLRGVGPDVGADGGSLDGNVGSFIEPSSVDYTFHGHGTRRTEAMPLNIALVTGSAKAATTGGEGSNAKFTCTGSGQRMTDLYPMCPRRARRCSGSTTSRAAGTGRTSTRRTTPPTSSTPTRTASATRTSSPCRRCGSR